MSEMALSGSTPPVTQNIITVGSKTPGIADNQGSDCIDSRAIITVIRDPNHSLGKRFEVTPNGSISKSSNVRLSICIAVQHHVASHAELAAPPNAIGNDPHAIIISASIGAIENGEEFISEIEKQLGIPTGNREQPPPSQELKPCLSPQVTQAPKKRRYDLLAAELDKILEVMPEASPTKVWAELLSRIGSENTCVTANIGDRIKWENSLGDVKTLTIGGLTERIRGWKKSKVKDKPTLTRLSQG